jgi:hypothetical protein
MSIASNAHLVRDPVPMKEGHEWQVAIGIVEYVDLLIKSDAFVGGSFYRLLSPQNSIPTVSEVNVICMISYIIVTRISVFWLIRHLNLSQFTIILLLRYLLHVSK